MLELVKQPIPHRLFPQLSTEVLTTPPANFHFLAPLGWRVVVAGEILSNYRAPRLSRTRYKCCFQSHSVSCLYLQIYLYHCVARSLDIQERMAIQEGVEEQEKATMSNTKNGIIL